MFSQSRSQRQIQEQADSINDIGIDVSGMEVQPLQNSPNQTPLGEIPSTGGNTELIL